MVEPVELLGAADAARLLGITRQRVVELAADPGFPPSRPAADGGRGWPRAALEVWAAGHPGAGPVHRGPALPAAGGLAPVVGEVAALAAAEARALDHDWVGVEHLLAALASPDCPGAAPTVLASFGITAERVREAIVAGHGDAFAPGAGWTTPAPDARSVLERAHLEAVLLADADVSSEHVLLALVGWWAEDTTLLAGLRRRGVDPAEVRRRVLDHTEGLALPRPGADAAATPAAQDWPQGLELAPGPGGADPRRRQPWGSAMFVDGAGEPVRRADGKVLAQYLVDRDGHPVLTADGRPLHLAHDEQGRWILDGDGRPVVVAVDIPEGSTLRPAV